LTPKPPSGLPDPKQPNLAHCSDPEAPWPTVPRRSADDNHIDRAVAATIVQQVEGRAALVEQVREEGSKAAALAEQEIRRIATVLGYPPSQFIDYVVSILAHRMSDRQEALAIEAELYEESQKPKNPDDGDPQRKP
jgi:hypothetical protein